MKVSEEILNLVPYKAGKPILETKREFGLTQVIKLASNENPLGASQKVVEALSKAIHEVHRYPDPSCYDLIEAVSKKWSIPVHTISVGNGSNEVIDLLIRIYCEPKNAILTTEMAFIAYQICAQAARVKTLFSPLKDGFKLNLDSMAEILRADKSKNIKLVFIPNPNNPTGTYVGKIEVKKFLDEFGNDPDRLIVFDEAYNEYVRALDYSSALEFFNEFKNVVIIRTLSKAYGLAGLRVGILIAKPDVIDFFNRVRNPFNVNELAQVAAIAALGDHDYLKKAVEANSKGLDYFYQELKKLNLKFTESQANFILVNLEQDVTLINRNLLQKGVILRPIGNYGLNNFIRISVGLPAENQFAIQAIREVLKV